MISIIVCSIKPDLVQELERNVASTIGVPYEFLAYDNRETGKGICAVYNECAEKAKYDILFFIHEDVLFHTRDWGSVLAKKLAEPDCGVIGFAGGTTKYPYPYGWQSIRCFTRKNYIRGKQKGRKASLRKSGSTAGYDAVVTLDGMALCVRKDVWDKIRFDDVTFRGFHSYDTDFTTAAFAAGYLTYVCNEVLFEHLSQGSFSKEWYESVKLYLQKWQDKLPLYAKGSCTDLQLEGKRKDVETFAILQLVKNRIITKEEARKEIRDYISRYGLGLNVIKMWLKLKKYSNN